MFVPTSPGSSWAGDKVKVIPKRSSEAEPCCCVCQDRVPNVKMTPCNHKLCNLCVQSMRLRVVQRASKGFECPLCRGTVTEFVAADPTDQCLCEALVDANAAAARLGKTPDTTSSAGASSASSSKPSTSVPPPTWTCTACTTANKLSVTECTGCGNERVQPATRGKTLSNQLDVQSCSAEDAYQALLIRFHFSINHLLEDAGMTVVVERGKIQVRSEASAVIAAARRNGHKKLHRLALLLQGRIHELARHAVGTFGLQDLLVAGSELRRAAEHAQETNPADADKLLFTPGPDIVSILLHGMAADARAMAVHKNANYTIQKALEVASEAELLDLATPLLQDLYGVYKGGYRLPQGKKLINTATFVLRAAVLRMVNISQGTSELQPHAAHLFQLACLSLRASTQTWLLDDFTSNHEFSRIVVMCIQGALPSQAAITLLMGMTEENIIRQCMYASHGFHALGAICAMRSPDPTADQYLVAAASNIAAVVQDQLAAIALSRNNNGPHFIRELYQRMAVSEQTAWLNAIVLELAEAAGEMQGDKVTAALLLHVMSHPKLDDAMAYEAMQVCEQCGGRLRSQARESLRKARNWDFSSQAIGELPWSNKLRQKQLHEQQELEEQQRQLMEQQQEQQQQQQQQGMVQQQEEHQQQAQAFENNVSLDIPAISINYDDHVLQEQQYLEDFPCLGPPPSSTIPPTTAPPTTWAPPTTAPPTTAPPPTWGPPIIAPPTMTLFTQSQPPSQAPPLVQEQINKEEDTEQCVPVLQAALMEAVLGSVLGAAMSSSPTSTLSKPTDAAECAAPTTPTASAKPNGVTRRAPPAYRPTLRL